MKAAAGYHPGRPTIEDYTETAMPYRYRVIPSQQLGILTVYGEVSGDAIIEATTAMSNDEAWSPGYDRLTDARDVTHLDMGVEHLHALRRAVLEGRSRAARGAVVTTREVSTTMANVFKMTLRKDRPVEVFHTMDEALAWLGKELPDEPQS